MQELVREYLNELGKKQKNRRRFHVITAIFAIAVVSAVIWGLSRSGFATTGEPKCGIEEHQHTDECYSSALSCGQEEAEGHTHTDECYEEVSNLICGQEESEEHAHTEECYQTEAVLSCGQEEAEGHTHTEECYVTERTCGVEEHLHEEECYIDRSADVEDASAWAAEYEAVEWQDAWGEDLVKAAELQLGYKESVENYEVAEDGTHKGYTRYGQFAEEPYTNWDASFVNFCMYYAGLTNSGMFPDENNTDEWYNRFVSDDEGNKTVYIASREGYEPEAGDVVFLRNEERETEFQMGIVSSYNNETNEVTVIEGNCDNQVQENTYDVNDEHISEYLKIGEMENVYKGVEEEQPEVIEDGMEADGAESDAEVTDGEIDEAENDAEAADGETEEAENDADESDEKTDADVDDSKEETDEDAQKSDEETIELTTEVDETVITLSGPKSSFEDNKEYTIHAEKVEDKEVLETVDEAVEQLAEEQEKKVENYQAFDIKLLVDGEEVQPLGPVEVKFSGKEVVKSVENEETEVSVIHVDEKTGETVDMEAAATEEKEVVIEVEHFSVYVYLETTDILDEETIELTTEVDGTVITLSGPKSSFEDDKEYTIQAEKVEDKKVLETVEEAVEQLAEEQEKKVENYQAFDIKLLVDGEEVQPLGPVEVKFSGKEVVKSVENDETEVSVIHVDEKTGETTDMEAAATDEKEIVIETEHFSVYVYVEVGVGAIEGANINIQHWGEFIETVDSDHEGKNLGTKNDLNYLVKEEGFETDEKQTNASLKNAYVVKKSEQIKLYSTDQNYKLPSETYKDVRELSKVYNVDQGERYEITKVWISIKGKEGKCKEDSESWGTKNVDYEEYTADQLTSEKIVAEINSLANGSVVRFWYKPKEKMVQEPVTFYDYDFSTGATSGKLYTEEQGINASGNFANNGKPKLGVGQASSGNASSWVSNKFNNQFLNAGNGSAKAFTGLVKKELNGGANGTLAFNTGIDVPSNLFDATAGVGGSKQYDDYSLEFEQKGDTYTLINVYKGTELTAAQNLTSFKARDSYLNRNYVFTNDFWPLDSVSSEDRKDPLLGEKNYQILNNKGEVEKSIGRNTGYGENDFKTEDGHNWYFGMTYTVRFTLGDYTGPLEYYFRGDDDFWLYVDGKLAVDLGGIHTAIGKTYNLDYLKNEDKNKEHVLQVYYMERGATGSTCYMQFTLPKAKIDPLQKPATTSYTINKEWDDNENGFRPQDIQITLYKQKVEEVNGEEVKTRVAARTITLPLRNEKGEYVDQNGNVVQNPVWTYTWSDLPVIDGKTGKPITYDADEELIDPSNKTNPMLGYNYKKEVTANGTQITMTNFIEDKKVKVCKKWNGDENELENRPNEVEFVLYANGEEYKDHNGQRRTIILSAANNWQGEFDHVPEYYYNSTTTAWEKVEYSVREATRVIGNNGEFDGLNGAIYDIDIKKVDIKDDTEIPNDQKKNYIAYFEATNTLVTKNICIEKISKSNNDAHLRGAVFNLYSASDFDADGKLKPNASLKGSYTTDDNGRIDISGLRFGEYRLVEIQAPTGFAILEKPIKIEASKTGVTVDFQIPDWTNDVHVTLVGGKYCIEIPNEIMYELPSTGGTGIYWYMFSGVLLMTGATLMTYRKKRRGVLRS